VSALPQHLVKVRRWCTGVLSCFHEFYLCSSTCCGWCCAHTDPWRPSIQRESPPEEKRGEKRKVKAGRWKTTKNQQGNGFVNMTVRVFITEAA